MAEYKIHITETEIIKTLTFKGKEYVEKWVDGLIKGDIFNDIYSLVRKEHPFLDNRIVEIVDKITYMDYNDIYEAIDELSIYEREENY